VDGFRAAVPLVLGIETGLYTWVIASALGVAAVVAASETAYTVLRYVGAGVLLLLGVQACLASRRISVESPAVAEPVAPSRWWRAATTGAVTQLGNPKVAVFMVAFFPQFIPYIQRPADHLAARPDPGRGGRRVVPAARDLCRQGKKTHRHAEIPPHP
jgi:threonine/homoserine/homoserine lactone efflux protein